MRWRNVTLLILFALLGSCVGSCALSGNLMKTVRFVYYYFIYQPPREYVKDIYLDRKGLLINDTFTATKDCAYHLTLRMIHKKGRMREYDHFFVNRKLPVNMELSVDKLNQAGAEPVFHVIREPRVHWHGWDSTGLGLGVASLRAGRYRIRLRSLTDLPAVHGIAVRFRAGGSPKTICTRIPPDRRSGR